MNRENVMTLEIGKVRRGTVTASEDECGNPVLQVRLYRQTESKAKPEPLYRTVHGVLRRYKSKWVAEFHFPTREYGYADIADILEDEASDIADWLAYGTMRV